MYMPTHVSIHDNNIQISNGDVFVLNILFMHVTAINEKKL